MPLTATHSDGSEKSSSEGGAITNAAVAAAAANEMLMTGASISDSPTPPAEIAAEEDFDVIKARLLADKERKRELHREIGRALVEYDAGVAQASWVRDEAVYRAAVECHAEVARARMVLNAAVDRADAELRGMLDRMEATERSIGVLVNAPVRGGHDPFTWLPDELIVMVLVMVSGVTLWSGACERVCQRWARLMQSPLVKRRMRVGRWVAYEAGLIQPRELEGHESEVTAIAQGLDDRFYTASMDRTVRVWSSVDGAHLQTLRGHTDRVFALAVGLDGKIFSGSDDATVRVWSGVDGAHIQTLHGHTHWVRALAIGVDGKVYSGSSDTTIRVWSGDDGHAHLYTLEGHHGTLEVASLAVGLDGKLYSGSGGGYNDEANFSIEVWSGVDGTHFYSHIGHRQSVVALAVGRNGNIFSGSWDSTIRVWDGTYTTLLGTIDAGNRGVSTMIAGKNDEIYWTGASGTAAAIHVIPQSAVDNDHIPLCTLCLLKGSVRALAVTRDGTLISGGGYETVYRDEDAEDYDPNANVAFSGELKLW